MEKRALITASVASMIGLFNMENIRILQSMGYEVDVAANFSFGSNISQERVEECRRDLKTMGVGVYQVPIPRSIVDIRHILISYFQLKKICRQGRYKLVHTQTPVGGVLTRFAARQNRKKGTFVIYAAHGFHFFKGAPKKNWLIFYTIEKYASKFTDVLITINSEDYQAAQKLWAKQVRYLPGIGIDLEKYQRDSTDIDKLRRSLNLKKEDFVLLSVGELCRRKNQEVLIRAMAEIGDKDVKYLIVGLGDLKETYCKLIKEFHLQDRVFLLGYRKDVSELLHVADIFVFPSLQEGLPAALMEAMAAGLPTVSGKIRGNVDLVTDEIEGRLVDPTDSHAYAEAILDIKKHPGKAALYGENAKKKIQQFSKEVVNQKMREIYNDIKI